MNEEHSKSKEAFVDQTSKDSVAQKPQSTRREKKKISYPLINIMVSCSSNNTRFTATAPNGDCIAWSSAGSSGFKGSKKCTPHAANEAASRFIEKMSKYSVKSAYLIFKGISPSKDAIAKSIASAFPVSKIIDKTGIAFNGCRQPGRRAV